MTMAAFHPDNRGVEVALAGGVPHRAAPPSPRAASTRGSGLRAPGMHL